MRTRKTIIVLVALAALGLLVPGAVFAQESTQPADKAQTQPPEQIQPPVVAKAGSISVEAVENAAQLEELMKRNSERLHHRRGHGDKKDDKAEKKEDRAEKKEQKAEKKEDKAEKRAEHGDKPHDKMQDKSDRKREKRRHRQMEGEGGEGPKPGDDGKRSMDGQP